MKTIPLSALLLITLLSAVSCRQATPPVVETVRLPAAVDGHAYETDVVLDNTMHVSPNWTIPRNSNFKIEPVHDGSGAHMRFILRHSGQGYLYEELRENRYEILQLHGHSGGGSAYRDHRVNLVVRVFRENDPNLQYCTLLQPKTGIKMYDCRRLDQIREAAVKDGTFCQKFAREC